MVRKVGTALAMMMLLASGGRAYADDVQKARQHYQEGTKAYDLGRFDDAAREYEQAYEAKDDPALLFNIAQAYRFGKRYDKAILSYRSYLRRVPNAPNRAEVQSIITELQRLVDAQQRTERKPPTDTLQLVAPATSTPPTPAPAASAPPVVPQQPPPAPTVTAAAPTPDLAAVRRGRQLKLVGIGVGAVGVAAVVSGGALWGVAGATADRLNHLSAPTPFDPAEERRFNTFQTAGIALIAVGGAALVTGTALLVVGVRRERAQRVALVPSTGTGTAFAGGF